MENTSILKPSTQHSREISFDILIMIVAIGLLISPLGWPMFLIFRNFDRWKKSGLSSEKRDPKRPAVLKLQVLLTLAAVVVGVFFLTPLSSFYEADGSRNIYFWIGSSMAALQIVICVALLFVIFFSSRAALKAAINPPAINKATLSLARRLKIYQRAESRSLPNESCTLIDWCL